MSSKTVYSLRMQLENIDEEDLKELRKYALVKEGIIRDILVPSDITLYGLHFAIQKAFGFFNGHLHHFEYDRDLVRKLTYNRFINWADYCGIYFRFPNEDYDDIYWDDDYSSGSFKKWLKKKYTGPYDYRGVNEHYALCQKEVADDLAINREILSFSDYQSGKRTGNKLSECLIDEVIGYYPSGVYELLERLPLDRVISLCKSTDWDIRIRKELDDKKSLISKAVQSVTEVIEGADLVYGKLDIHNSKQWYELRNKLLSEHAALLKNTDPETYPLTDSLNYYYDYGDGWEIRITLTNEYIINGDEITDLMGLGVNEKLKEKITAVAESYCPAGLYVDGLNPVEDVGGIGSLIDFYCTVSRVEFFRSHVLVDGNEYRYDQLDDDVAELVEKADSLLNWAENQFWSPSKPSVKHLL